MKRLSFLLSALVAVALVGTCCGIYKTAKGKKQLAEIASNSKPVSHEIWDGLLKKFVDENGMVNYKALQKDSAELNKYLQILEANHPNEANWNRAEQMAFWINAYNAFTARLILRNYPLTGIKEIGGKIPFVNSTWDIKFIKIESTVYDLNNIEHNILRPKFKDPRIHFAVNCASKSCAKLQREAFTAAKLDSQLERAGRDFLNDPAGRNKIKTDVARVSMYFKWFEDDFKRTEPTVWQFINRYSDTKISAATKLEFQDYDWNLNEQ